jgi:hypothetical protein
MSRFTLVSMLTLLTACGGASTGSMSPEQSTLSDQTMSVEVRGHANGGSVDLKAIRLSLVDGTPDYELRLCISSCLVDMTKDHRLVDNQPISRKAGGRLYVNGVEARPVLPNSWYAKDGVYRLPSNMGYTHTLYLSYDGSSWTYDADVTH